MINSIKLFFIICTIGLIFSSCVKEQIEQDADLINIQFSALHSEVTNEGGRILDFEDPSFLLLSLESVTGEVVLNMEKISIYKFGSSYISEPILLEPRKYKVTDFLLVSESNEILYAVPKQGSALQDIVSKNLPFNFTVKKDISNSVELEVVSVYNYDANDLGYASFSSHIINPLKLAVFTADNPGALTDATAVIMKDDEILQSIPLDAKINLISISGDANAIYSIKVEKSGYNPYSFEFYYSELVNTLTDLILEIVLQRPLAISAITDSSGSFEIDLNGNTGQIQVDFGDGIVTNYTLSQYLTIAHTYSTNGNYEVVVTGDLHLISGFRSYYGMGKADQIDMSSLTGLKSIQFGLTTQSPSIINLSNSPLLTSVDLSGCENLDELILPSAHSIRSILVDGPNLLDFRDMDYLINNIHENTVSNGINDGIFSLGISWINTPNPDNEMIGPPSVESIEKLRELRDTYNWHINPDPS